MAIRPRCCATQCWHAYCRGLSLAALQPVPSTLPLPFSLPLLLLSIVKVPFFPLLRLRSRTVISFSTWIMKMSLIHPSLLNPPQPQSPLIALDSVAHLVPPLPISFAYVLLLHVEVNETVYWVVNGRALSRAFFGHRACQTSQGHYQGLNSSFSYMCFLWCSSALKL